MRSCVIGCATLAILLVVYSMLQYTQPETANLHARTPRLPSTPPMPEPGTASGASGGVPFGQGMIGRGQNITISIYPSEGTRAKFELSVRDWTPKDGSDHEFLLSAPEIRLRTKEGNDVRVTAREGILDAQRKSGGTLDPRRGELSGDVVIEFDRRTDKDKALLPAERRDVVDPGEIVRVETDRLEFDMQYSRLSVPGRIRLTARDASLEGEDLAIRFDEHAGRVESLRIARGGKLQLLDTEALQVRMPSMRGPAVERSTLVGWLLATVQSKLDAAAAAQQAATAAPTPPPVVAEPGVPVFRTTEPQDRPEPPVRYVARFDGGVDARELFGGVTRSRLEAETLEVQRDFSERDRVQADARTSSSSAAGPQASPTSEPQSSMQIEWSGRLVVENVALESRGESEPPRSTVVATGAPVRISNLEGEALCAELLYEPDRGFVELKSQPDRPVVVRSLEQGEITGASAVVRRQAETLEIEVVGPGALVGNPSSTFVQGAASVEPQPKSTTVIEFSERLQAVGRFVAQSSIDFTGTRTTRERRRLDQAVFTRNVRVRDGDAAMSADELTVRFGDSTSARDDRPRMERVTGVGNVTLTQRDERITGQSMDVTFAAAADGRPQPTVAKIEGNVQAVQGERILSAKDSLIVEFGTSEASTIVRRLVAQGAIEIHDPVQNVDLTAEHLDCTISRGKEIETALVVGSTDRPAHVGLDGRTVSGQRVQVNVPDQWAEVPGAGRMTFLSRKDLDGRPVKRPVPIAVTWTESMRFRGRENRAEFDGGVHATSESTTTFDCSRLLIEFQDVPPPDESAKKPDAWGILRPFVNQVTPKPRDSVLDISRTRFSKEPVYMLADGQAVAETSEVHPESGQLLSRSRISGPRLSVSLRAEASKMLIEGAGNLQLEDFHPPTPNSASQDRKRSDLFNVDADTGPSKTLIEWRDRMSYDFGIAQTRFEGKVTLKHFSGAALEKLFDMGPAASGAPGRSTFLNADALTVDFLGREERTKEASVRRMGRLSADNLRQFQAAGSVTLQDQVEGLSVTADTIVYEKPRQLLAISGSKTRKAHIITQKPGRAPHQVSTERLFYNLATSRLELVETTVQGQ